ncbi:dolichyl pyrophosphate Man9GlcNAc2 alpha-1,3-glucosyltransferase [Reticulomyxa filosa]|uniref:Alpha-1,3-glucosyltransferase n=1 Tax=Reticulomyxa filosa TaxID=46433 RepID=X6MDM2_RETFI|nr:dolichyl pyrophosphate Man9GlcNAc2 alpha-1,3-glucosyltransferase [Reticulomyxa filosa]|eukprot:ETO11761.1 dolichyl pyrophosphate Man9GlcNAc2 alpha-1,3-glucosyltransferase [Reticulomyxa filosa]
MDRLFDCFFHNASSGFNLSLKILNFNYQKKRPLHKGVFFYACDIINLEMSERLFRTHHLLQYFERNNTLQLGVLCISILAVFVRLCVGVGSYSGMHKPPMYGDFEAQRHWMEITSGNKNSSANDLMYWGLDYPPLSAYHSYICGKLAQWLNPAMIALHESRGNESNFTKMFMRMSSVISDALIFFPAFNSLINLFVHRFIVPKKNKTKKNKTRHQQQKNPYVINNNKKKTTDGVLCVLLSPLFILIDHGHFQYNSVCLGLILWSINCMLLDYHLLGCVLFVCALSFKVMALYFAIPFFCYCIGDLLKRQKNGKEIVLHVIMYGVTVIASCAIVFSPWLLLGDNESNSGVKQVLHRMFPLGRGLFEDKVANAWCATNIAMKWREILGNQNMAYISAIVTFLVCLPSSIALLKHTTKKHFIYCLSSCGLAFFLFSYQAIASIFICIYIHIYIYVHEKNVLFPMLPITLLVLETPYFVLGLTCIATFSMLPLLEKDGLIYWYWSLQIIFYGLAGHIQPLHRARPTPFPTDSTLAKQAGPIHDNLHSGDNGSDEDEKDDNGDKKKVKARESGVEYGGDRTPTQWERPDPIRGYYKYWLCVPIVTLLLYLVSKVEFSQKFPDIGTYIIIIFSFANFVLAYFMILFQQINEVLGVSDEMPHFHEYFVPSLRQKKEQ